jgi:hypothetical protein
MIAETIIEIRPHRGGWQAFEAPGVQPFYVGPNAKEFALSYAQGRTAMRKGEIRIYDSIGKLERTIPFDQHGRKVSECLKRVSLWMRR